MYKRQDHGNTADPAPLELHHILPADPADRDDRDIDRPADLFQRLAAHLSGIRLRPGRKNSPHSKEMCIRDSEYTVRKVYSALKDTEDYISRRYNYIEPLLPDDIFFITSQELEDLYPDLTPKERENVIARDKGAVFISQIGKVLASGEKHDGRAPDYDDWELNGDIIVYYPVLDMGLELSSMGIRVDEESLRRQLKLAGCEERAELPFQKSLLNGELDVYKRQGPRSSSLTQRETRSRLSLRRKPRTARMSMSQSTPHGSRQHMSSLQQIPEQRRQ